MYTVTENHIITKTQSRRVAFTGTKSYFHPFQMYHFYCQCTLRYGPPDQFLLVWYFCWQQQQPIFFVIYLLAFNHVYGEMSSLSPFFSCSKQFFHPDIYNFAANNILAKLFAFCFHFTFPFVSYMEAVLERYNDVCVRMKLELTTMESKI